MDTKSCCGLQCSSSALQVSRQHGHYAPLKMNEDVTAYGVADTLVRGQQPEQLIQAIQKSTSLVIDPASVKPLPDVEGMPCMVAQVVADSMSQSEAKGLDLLKVRWVPLTQALSVFQMCTVGNINIAASRSMA